MKKKVVSTLDRTDTRILRLVQENGRIPIAELAATVSLSPSACARRIRLLEDRGVIHGYTARVDQAAVGLPMVAFVLVSMSRKSEEIFAAFDAAISKAPEVMDAYLMTGRDDYLLRVVVADLPAYESFVKQRLTRFPGVLQVETHFVLRHVTARAALPISGAE